MKIVNKINIDDLIDKNIIINNDKSEYYYRIFERLFFVEKRMYHKYLIH